MQRKWQLLFFKPSIMGERCGCGDGVKRFYETTLASEFDALPLGGNAARNPVSINRLSR
jgi:hypothetical protein